MNKVFILIPTFNRSEILKLCLDCIHKQTSPNYQTIVINDGSRDNTSAIISKYPKTTELKGDGHLWWTGAMRKGVEYILPRSKKGDWVLLMNDDTKFDKDYIKKIIGVGERPKRSIITSVCLDIKTKSKVLEAGVKVDWTKPRFDQPLKPPTNLSNAPLTPVDTACGRGTLIPIEVFNQIGNFTCHLPHYGADYEFMIRAREAGFPLYISYQCRVFATAKAGGVSFVPGRHLTIGKLWQQMFSRRSKSNIVDQLMFILLTVPKPLIPLRFYFWIKDIVFRTVFLFRQKTS